MRGDTVLKKNNISFFNALNGTNSIQYPFNSITYIGPNASQERARRCGNP